MGTFRVPIEIGNQEGDRWQGVDAYADTGAHFSAVPQRVWQALGLKPTRRVTFRMADGGTQDQDVGRGRIRVNGQETDTSIVLGGADTPCLLGALAMEDLLLAPDPVRKRLIPVEPVMLAELPAA